MLPVHDTHKKTSYSKILSRPASLLNDEDGLFRFSPENVVKTVIGSRLELCVANDGKQVKKNC
jgi:hypothetical protein